MLVTEEVRRTGADANLPQFTGGASAAGEAVWRMKLCGGDRFYSARTPSTAQVFDVK